MAWAREGQVGTGSAPEGAVEITSQQYKAAIEGMTSGKVVTITGGFAVIDPPQPEPEPEPDTGPPTQQDYADAIQARVDTVARSRNYTDGVSLASYAASTNAAWAAEAAAFIAWRDDVWVYAYGEFAKVQNGERPQPTVDEIVSELPTITWP